MHMIHVESQTIDNLVGALISMEARGLYEYNEADHNLLEDVRDLIERREFLTVAQHQAIVQMAVRYL